jgi:hypothetical protein
LFGSRPRTFAGRHVGMIALGGYPPASPLRPPEGSVRRRKKSYKTSLAGFKGSSWSGKKLRGSDAEYPSTIA